MITTRPKLKSRIEDLAPPSPALSPLSPPPSPYISHSSTLASPKPTLVVSMRRGGNGMGVDPEGVAWYLRWAVSPLAALRMLLVPLVLAGPTHLFLLFINWVASGHRVSSSRPGGAEEGEGWAQGWRRADWTAYNPFTPFFLVSYPTPPPSLSPVTAPFFPSLSSFFVESPSTVTYTSTSPPSTTEQLYSKGPRDLALLTWLILLFSLLRLLFSHHVFPLLARRWGISKRAKVERFGEQGYQVVYFSVVGLWGIYNMLHSRTGWFDTRAFWAAYPHTHLPGPLKAYYLTQIAYWLQQALVLGLGLEKRRSDHWELVIHHVVTVWMVTWSYMMNVTLLGNAVFVSMDIPDVLLAFSKMLNYLRLERAKVVSFAVFVVGWSYFRHYISIRILWSLRTEFGLVPNQTFDPLAGMYMALWVRDQMFGALCVLQALNLFWFWLILRILYRTIMVSETDDNRSDAEEEVEEVDEKEKEQAKETVGSGEKQKQMLGVGLGASLARDKSKDAPMLAPSRSKSENRKERGAGGGLSAVGNGNGNGNA